MKSRVERRSVSLAGLVPVVGLPLLAASGLLVGQALLPGTVAAQQEVEERHPLDADGRLRVEAVRHDIVLRAWDREEVHAVATIDERRERLEVRGDEGDVTVRIRYDDRRNRGGTRGSATLEIRAPAGARLAVTTVSGDQRLEGVRGSVRGTATSGMIEVVGDPSSVDLEVVSGDIRVEGAVSRIAASAVSGDVVVLGGRGRVEANTVSGEVRVEAGGPLDEARLKTVSGSVEVDAVLDPRARLEAETHSGSVRLRLPPDTPAEYELRTHSGSIRNGLTDDRPETREFGPGESLFFTVGAATAAVRLQAFSGTVRLEPRR